VVVSEPGQGCEFRVSFDAVDGPGPDTPPSAPAAAGSVASAVEDGPLLRVLCIEDNPVNMILVQGLVALRPRVSLYCAVDGLSGVAMALAQRPEVVLIDMQLPDIDGFEVQRRLRAEPMLAASRLIALSANGLAEDIARGMAAGFDDYWTKPIDFKLFLKKLDELIATPR
jgi:CheY-like chemotaxis protein